MAGGADNPAQMRGFCPLAGQLSAVALGRGPLVSEDVGRGRFAIGCQPLPATFLRLLPNPAVQALLRWRMPESVEGLTIDPGAVVIKTSS